MILWFINLNKKLSLRLNHSNIWYCSKCLCHTFIYMSIIMYLWEHNKVRAWTRNFERSESYSVLKRNVPKVKVFWDLVVSRIIYSWPALNINRSLKQVHFITLTFKTALSKSWWWTCSHQFFVDSVTFLRLFF